MCLHRRFGHLILACLGLLLLAAARPSAAVAAPPPNDDFVRAMRFDSLPFADELDPSDATSPAGDPVTCAEHYGRSVRYRFMPSTAGWVRADAAGSDYPTVLAAFSGRRGDLTPLDCNLDDPSAREQSRIAFAVQPGTTYYLLVGSWGTAGRKLVLNVDAFDPPPNDDIDDAVAIAALPFTDERDPLGATEAPDDPPCTRETTLWYRYTPSVLTHIEADLEGSDDYPSLAVYTGTRGDLSLVDCKSDRPVAFDAVPGTTYYFLVGSDRHDTKVDFNARALPPPANDGVDTARRIAALPFADDRDVSGATKVPTDPSACASYRFSVWYRFAPSTSTGVGIRTDGTDYDSLIAVYRDTGGGFVDLACTTADRLTFDSLAGTTYFVLVAASEPREEWIQAAGRLVLAVEAPAAPPNDDFDRAVPVDPVPFADERDALGATKAPDDPAACAPYSASVWYRYVPATSGRVRAAAGPFNDELLLAVYGGRRDRLTAIACGSQTRDPGSGRLEGSTELFVDVVTGRTYHFLVGAPEPPGFGRVSFELEAVSRPAHDDFDRALPVGRLPYRHTVDTGGAVRAADDPPACSSSYGASVWYRFVPPTAAGFVALTGSGAVDTVLAVYTGERGNLTMVASNDDVGESADSEVVFDGVPGTTYYLMVGAYGGNDGGLLQLTVDVGVDMTLALRESEPDAHVRDTTLFYDPAADGGRFRVDAAALDFPVPPQSVAFPRVFGGDAHLDHDRPFSTDYAWRTGESVSGTFEVQADPGHPEALSATFEVRPDARPPTVAIVAPRRGAVVRPGALIRVQAEDRHAGVARVRVVSCPGTTCAFEAGATVGVATRAPYEVAWGELPADGTYTLVAEARDHVGHSARSAPITVTVRRGRATAAGAPPTTDPAASASTSDTAPPTGSVTAPDPGLGRTRDEPDARRVDAGKLAAGPALLRAVAIDGAGTATPSPSVRVTVANRTPPEEPAPAARWDQSAATES